MTVIYLTDKCYPGEHLPVSRITKWVKEAALMRDSGTGTLTRLPASCLLDEARDPRRLADRFASCLFQETKMENPIKKMRAKLRYTIEEFAAALRLCPEYLASVERGEIAVPESLWEALEANDIPSSTYSEQYQQWLYERLGGLRELAEVSIR